MNTNGSFVAGSSQQLINDNLSPAQLQCWLNIMERVHSIQLNAGQASVSDVDLLNAWLTINPSNNAQDSHSGNQGVNNNMQQLRKDAKEFCPRARFGVPANQNLAMYPIYENEETAPVPVSPSSSSVTSATTVTSMSTSSSSSSPSPSTTSSTGSFPSLGSLSQSPPSVNLGLNMEQSVAQSIAPSVLPAAPVASNLVSVPPQIAIAPPHALQSFGYNNQQQQPDVAIAPFLYYPPFAYPGPILVPANGILAQIQSYASSSPSAPPLPYMATTTLPPSGLWGNVVYESQTTAGNCNAVDVEGVSDASSMMTTLNHTTAQPVLSCVSRRLFTATHNNHAKGNFYISKEMIQRLMKEAQEAFNTGGGDEENEKLTFAYYKESAALQINDEQLYIFSTAARGEFIPINIDLHFKHNGRAMYLVATANDEQFQSKVKWQISALMTADELCHKYGEEIRADLPLSSRQMPWFTDGMQRPPIDINVQRLNFKDVRHLKCKSSKRKNDIESGKSEHKTVVSTWALKNAIQQSFRDCLSPIVPVVVIKGKKQWIEWKRFVRIPKITDEFGRAGVIAISMRFYPQYESWKMECIDCDAGRVYYQHRLCSLDVQDPYRCEYNDLINRINVSCLKVN